MEKKAILVLFCTLLITASTLFVVNVTADWDPCHIALAEPIDLATNFSVKANQPAVTADIKVKGNFLADPENKHFFAKGLDATIIGDLLGGKDVSITASGDIDAKPETPEFLVDRNPTWKC